MKHLNNLGFDCEEQLEDDEEGDAADLCLPPMCFPWFLAHIGMDAATFPDHVKHDAADMCAPYLSLIRKLAEISVSEEADEKLSYQEDLPPTVAMTVDGKDVHISIVYMSSDGDQEVSYRPLHPLGDPDNSWLTKFLSSERSYPLAWRHGRAGSCLRTHHHTRQYSGLGNIRGSSPAFPICRAMDGSVPTTVC